MLHPVDTAMDMQFPPSEASAAAEGDEGLRQGAAADGLTLPGLDGRALNQSFLVVTCSPDGLVQAANFQFLRLFDCSLSDILGQDTLRFLSKSHDRQHLQDLWTRLRRGKRCQEVGLWIAKGGREVWLESRYIPMLNAQGVVEAVVQIAEDITERLAREVENRGQVAAVQATHAVAHFSLDGHVLWVNDLFLAATGYQRVEVLERPHAMFVDPTDHASEDDRQFRQELAQGHSVKGEFRRRHKDGSELWLQAVYTPILDPAGRPFKVVMYATDITAERRRQADFQWQVTAIHKSNCVVTFDLHGAILDANEMFLQEMGYPLDEVQGRHHRMFVEPTFSHGSEYASFWHDLRRGKHRAGLYKRIAKGGREVWLQATYNPIFDSAGKPVKIVKYASVVTDERLLQAEHQGQIAAIDQAQCVISFQLDGTILDANDNFLRAMGYRYAEVWGRHHRIFVPEEVAAGQEYRAFWVDLAAGAHRSGEFKRQTKAGAEIWLQASYIPIRDMNGRVFKVVKYATDVTQEKLRQADYQGQIEAIQKSQDVIVFGLDGTVLDVNDRFLKTLGYVRDEVVGQHHAMLLDRELAASNDYLEFWKALRAGKHQAGLYKRVGKGGREIWIQASYNPILDLNGRPFKVVKFASDVSANVEMAQAFEETKRQALLDSATSLPNRAKLIKFLDTHLQGQSAVLALLYLDLDKFRELNEIHGHRAGDRMLGEVADRLRRLLREDQMVARVGGDEFVIAAPGVGLDAAERLCQQVLEKVAAPIMVDENKQVSVSVSIGVALAPGDGALPDELLRAADTALSYSKRQGYGCRSYYSEQFNAKLHGQRKLIEDMRHSMAANHFFLEYQPRYATRTRLAHSVEALVRWSHPERGRISPVEFIPLAEQSGLIVPLGEWILQQACHTATRWPGFGVSVNLSPAQFSDDDLLRKVSEALKQSGLPPERLELEVTEGVLVADSRRALQVLTALKALGVTLAIDDFGTGYSSLSYLRNFPFDVLKIDRSFVSQLDAEDNSRPIVQAILALGRAIGLSVTAEGVETEEQFELLAQDGCDEIQGFLLAMPMPPEEIDKLARHQKV